MKASARNAEWAAKIRIVAIYALFGSLWIFLSDTVVGWMIRDPGLMTRISVYKGMLFILLTSALLYFLISRNISRMADFNLQLAKSEERFITIFNNMSDTIFIHDAATGALVDVNAPVFDMFGYHREEAIGLDIDDMSTGEPPYSKTEALRWFRVAADSETPVVLEWRYRRKDGTHFWAECSLRRAHIGDRQVIIVAARDISERKAVAETLRRSELFSSTLNRISRAFLTGKNDEEMFDQVLAAVLDVMQSPYGIFGYIDTNGSLVCPSITREIRDECRMSDKSAVFPECAWGDSIWGRTLRSGKAHCSNQPLAPPQGHIPIRRCLAVPLAYRGKTIGLLTVANKSRDYTEEDAQQLESMAGQVAPVLFSRLERQQASQAMRESENRLRVIFETAPVGIIMISPQGVITFANSRMTEMFGCDRDGLIGSPYLSRIHPDEHAAAEARLQRLIDGDAENSSAERQYCRTDGSCFWGYVSSRRYENVHGDLISIVCVISDITETKRSKEERRKLEQQMLHVQKLESLGVLAGGIAHDFNNILLAITGNASLALMRVGPESPAAHHLQQIEKAADKAADLARQMLAYSGRGRFVLEALDLNLIVEEMTNMLQVSISKNAILLYHLTDRLPSIMADATQIRQVVMNLVINASEAIGDRDGVISISTGCMDCDHEYLQSAWIDQNLPEGRYTYLEVADNGCGMTREIMERIFDPFFTTKFTGRGLGMAAILGIVRGHRGAIKVCSEPGKGSSFKILLPVCESPAELDRKQPDDGSWHGHGTVLLVDDEETIRAIGSEMLKKLGYDVITACDGREAAELYSYQRDRIAFVVLDLTMPYMNGEDTYRELRRINPEVKVIMTSGYNQQEITERFMGEGLAGFIQKPYRMSTLTNVVRNIMTPASQS